MTIARARSSRASSTIRRPACPARTFSQCPVTRRPPCRRACSISACAAASCSGIDGVDRRRGGDDDRDEDVDPAAPAGGHPHRGRDGARRVGPRVQRDEHRVVLGLVRDDRLGHRDAHGLGQVQPVPVAVPRVERAADEQPADAGDRDVDVQERHDGERQRRADRAEDREDGHVDAADRQRSSARGRAARRPACSRAA